MSCRYLIVRARADRAEEFPASSTSENPIMALSGVRISWLILRGNRTSG